MFANYIVATKENEDVLLRRPRPDVLFEYIMAGNGLWIRGSRRGLTAQIPVCLPVNPVRGLLPAREYVDIPRVGSNILNYLVTNSRESLPDERLFYLLQADQKWVVVNPQQTTTPGACSPVNPYSRGNELAVIEVHTHGTGAAFFSGMDDMDETGFKIYTVFGRLNTDRPEIAVRVGIYGHMAMVKAELVFSGLELMGVEDVFDRIC